MAADNMYITDVDGDDDDKRLLVKLMSSRAAVDELLLLPLQKRFLASN